MNSKKYCPNGNQISNGVKSGHCRNRGKSVLISYTNVKNLKEVLEVNKVLISVGRKHARIKSLESWDKKTAKVE